MKETIPENPGMHHSASSKLFEFARRHRENPTQAEALLWEALKDKRLDGHKFRQQHPIGRYILYFYCHASRLAIEVDGGYHLTKEQAEYDKNRTLELQRLGIKELRFINGQVIHDLERILESIRENLASLMLLVGPPTPEGEYGSKNG